MTNKTINYVIKTAMIIILTLLIVSIISVVLIPNNIKNISYADSVKISAKAAYLIDEGTGTVIYAKNEDSRLPVASMVKSMTLLLAFESIARNEISLADDVQISNKSASMGGSQVFLDENSTHKVNELVKSIVVASANDSCVAIAEHISGSTDAFIKNMNVRAKELGMTNTNYTNCTGLPEPENFSSAKDNAMVFAELIKHDKYFEFASIWLENYKHPSGRETTITNTNKLVRFYKGCDGGKTGFTNEAKFCLTATAKRGDMRLIAVVIGDNSSKSRNALVSSLFNLGFDNYENKILLKKNELIENNIEVIGGKNSTIKLTVEDNIAQFIKNGDSAKFEIKYELPQKIKAGIKKGCIVGKAYLTKDGIVVKEYDVVSSEDVLKSNVFDELKRIAEYWC